MGDASLHSRSRLTRRGLLTGAAGAAGAVLLAGCEDPRPSDGGFKPAAVSATALPPVAPVTALNTVLAIEHQAIFAYTALVPLLTDPAVAALAGGFRRDHEAHRDALVQRVAAAAGQPAAAKPPYDLGSQPKTQADALLVAAGLEALAAATYYKMVASTSDPDLLRFLASIMGDEAQHAAVLEGAAGKRPVPSSFQSAQPESLS